MLTLYIEGAIQPLHNRGHPSAYIKNRHVSRIEQRWAKIILSHAWIGAEVLERLLFLEVFKAVVWAFQNTIMIVEVQPAQANGVKPATNVIQRFFCAV